MSGTSADGIDVVLVEFSDDPKAQCLPRLLMAETYALEPTLGKRIFQLMSPSETSIDLLGETDALLGSAIGNAVMSFLRTGAIDPSSIEAIGCHGQTVRHRPGGEGQFTLQIGDPNRIAETTHLPVVADFRRRDMAAGGQGAPLAPAYHELLFRDPDEHRAVINIGGIANLTRLPPVAEPELVIGFDTGPGNALIDAWIQARLGSPQDTDGDWAKGAEPDQALLTRLLSDPYFHAPPPKSTGREYFHLEWLMERLPSAAIADQVIGSTLTELTVRSIVEATERWAPRTARMILCGGGRHNSELVRRLRRDSRMPVEPCEQLGVDGDFIEAAAFAWFAKCTLDGAASSRASVTGAKGDRVLGGLYVP